jgi:uncharacterized protein YecT (DUF1311 family)
MTGLFMALLSVLLLANVSGAQEQAQHPIDKALEACIDKNGSTAGMAECTDKAYAAWDRELNKNYVELMRTPQLAGLWQRQLGALGCSYDSAGLSL